jgi:uncharacterized protein
MSMQRYTGPLLTHSLASDLLAAQQRGHTHLHASFDLGRSESQVQLAAEHWWWQGQSYPYPAHLKARTLYYWDGEAFSAISRYTNKLIKLVPTEWDVPTFEIDGIKMLPTAKASPLDDARRKVALIKPQGKHVLETCGGLGYFAQCCLDSGVASLQSFEKNEDVLWLRSLNPWSPDVAAHTARLQLTHADCAQAIAQLPANHFDAILHDPPRFAIAGELYALTFYQQLARVLRRGGLLFHYTGSPNKLTSGRDVPREVAGRLQEAGFNAELALDGVLASKR